MAFRWRADSGPLEHVYLVVVCLINFVSVILTRMFTTPDPEYPMVKSDEKQLNITNESQEVSPFPAGDHKAAISWVNLTLSSDVDQDT